MQSLADFLGGVPAGAAGSAPGAAGQAPGEPRRELKELSPAEFCRAILQSPEFRTYLLNGITLGDLPPAVMLRIMDIGWGKPVERVEVRDKSDLLESITPEQIALRIERMQHMLRIVQAARDATESGDDEPAERVH